jgi:hypothetical protein
MLSPDARCCKSDVPAASNHFRKWQIWLKHSKTEPLEKSRQRKSLCARTGHSRKVGFGHDRDMPSARQMSAYDFIDESNPVRAIDVFVDALDLAEMRFEGWSRRRLVGHRTTPRLSSFREFPSSGISMLRGHDDQFEAPRFHGHTLIASGKYFAWPRIVVHRLTAP